MKKIIFKKCLNNSLKMFFSKKRNFLSVVSFQDYSRKGFVVKIGSILRLYIYICINIYM